VPKGKRGTRWVIVSFSANLGKQKGTHIHKKTKGEKGEKEKKAEEHLGPERKGGKRVKRIVSLEKEEEPLYGDPPLKEL